MQSIVFGLWDSSAHNDSDQQKRIASAKKADITPTFVDHEKKCAEFKGSGKSPYSATLDGCTCIDFVRRRMPCKHMYRLYFELQGTEVQRGVTKHEAKDLAGEIFTLSAEAQKILCGMCVLKIYHDVSVCVHERNEHSELLFCKGFCVQCVPTVELIRLLTPAQIRMILFSFEINIDVDLPKPKSQKSTMVAWLDTNFQLVFAHIDKHFVFLELSEYADKAKSTIHRRYTQNNEHVIID